ncbi:uncharacterized protein LOC110014374 isoform X3 [Oryzias latipes]|uniref:uncharacterized protein LOC110014374 isoform X3 n=1 Tax=Oryzias latipes TaxID=8090 RepID=UPI000CE21123|nr:uncharacterized protein LOC110014374 isoform X3 [Oryzias latipes]
MPQGSTTKHCVSCRVRIAVATKTCKICQTVQPSKQRLAKKLERFKAKKESWLQNHRKNKTTTHVLDEASVLVEKLHALGHRAVVFIARPGRKASTWHAHIVHPRWQLTDQAGKCLDRMKLLYELVITGWTNQQLSTAPAIQPSQAIQPAASSVIQQPAYAPAKKKKKPNDKEDSSGVLPQHWMTEEEDLCNQQTNVRVEQEDPEPLNFKEEQEEPVPPEYKEEQQGVPEPQEYKEELEEPVPPEYKEEQEEQELSHYKEEQQGLPEPLPDELFFSQDEDQLDLK